MTVYSTEDVRNAAEEVKEGVKMRTIISRRVCRNWSIVEIRSVDSGGVCSVR